MASASVAACQERQAREPRGKRDTRSTPPPRPPCSRGLTADVLLLRCGLVRVGGLFQGDLEFGFGLVLVDGAGRVVRLVLGRPGVIVVRVAVDIVCRGGRGCAVAREPVSVRAWVRACVRGLMKGSVQDGSAQAARSGGGRGSPARGGGGTGPGAGRLTWASSRGVWTGPAGDGVVAGGVLRGDATSPSGALNSTRTPPNSTRSRPSTGTEPGQMHSRAAAPCTLSPSVAGSRMSSSEEGHPFPPSARMPYMLCTRCCTRG